MTKEKCPSCNKAVDETKQCIWYMGKSWHKKCFLKKKIPEFDDKKKWTKEEIKNLWYGYHRTKQQKEEFRKGHIFLKHIQNHLKEDKYKDAEPKGQAICKICKKTADEIYEAEKK
jgi:hypothetical protein